MKVTYSLVKFKPKRSFQFELTACRAEVKTEFAARYYRDSPSNNISLHSRIRDRVDNAAWREFDARYRELMLRYCLGRGLDQVAAEDVFQFDLSARNRSRP